MSFFMAEKRIENIAYITILLRLSEGPVHGYELIKTLESYLGHKISPSHVYPFLKRMKDRGYIKVGETGNRRMKKYSLTPEGRKFVSRVLSRFRNIVDSFLLKNVKVCYHCGAKILEGGVSIRSGRKRLYFCCEHCKNHYLAHEGCDSCE